MEKMIADYSTKATQGALFVFQRNTILGIKDKKFGMCNEWYKKKLMEYDLWDDGEIDLDSL